jgi:hypothetical protein
MILREHVIKNRGQVTMEIISELIKAFQLLMNDGETKLNQENDLSFLNEAIGDDDDDEDDSSNSDEDTLQGLDPEVRELITSLTSFLSARTRELYTGSPPPPPSTSTSTYIPTSTPTSLCPSWGEVVDFLRYSCPGFQPWLVDLDASILPQAKAGLSLAFRQGDQLGRGVAHPLQLARAMARLPVATKILTKQTSFLRFLQQLQTNVTLVLSYPHGDIIDILNHNDSNNNDNSSVLTSHVSYELPLTWEEVLSQYISQYAELDNYPKQSHDLFKAQLLTLLGVCHVFFNEASVSVSEAEATLQLSLGLYEGQGLDQDLCCCELYNAIAQLMITKYKIQEKNIR